MDFNFYVFIGVTVLAVMSVFGLHVYYNFKNIQNSWSEYRCNPLYMPFAWMIMKEEDANLNFSQCIASYSSAIVKDEADVFSSQFSLIDQILSALESPLSVFRSMLTRIRGMMLSFTNSTLTKASGPVSAFAYTLNKIQDLFRKMAGEGVIAAFFGITAVSFIEGFVTLAISVIKGFVLAMLAISIVLAFFQPELLAIVLVLASLLARAGA